MRRHTHHQFVQEAGEKKNHGAGELVAETAADEGRVYMSAHEVVNGFVPRAPVTPHGGTIPPVGVKLPVTEPHDFR